MLTIAADERAALQFEDVASALDAGLPVVALGPGVAADERALHGALRQRGVSLTTTEDQVIAASWRAGRASGAMRSCAAARRQRAEFQRQLWSGLRYPYALLSMTFVAALATMRIIGNAHLVLGTGALLLSAIALPLWIQASLRRGRDAVTRLPVLGGLITQVAELPFLEVLQSLYASGVPLPEAHRTAVATVRLPSMRARLDIADRIVHDGRTLAEGLHEAVALHAETRTLLANGERAGQLEEALARALTRRREVASRGIADFARRTSTVVYFLAAVTVAAIVVQFYTSYFAMLRI